MEELTKFKNRIFIYSLAIMAIIEMGSLPFQGLDWKFLCGLVLGTAMAIANFNIMTLSSIMLLSGKSLIGIRKVFASANFMIRLVLYGIIFYLSMRLSVVAGVASVCGFMTLRIAIYVIYVIIPFVRKDFAKRHDIISIDKQILTRVPRHMVCAMGRQILTFVKADKRKE
jgi:hypothetical protein